MAPTNWWLTFLIALVPLAVGAVWYGPLFGKLWQREAGVTDEQMENANMLKIFGLSYVYSVLVTLLLHMVVIHQFGLCTAAVSGSFSSAASSASTGCSNVRAGSTC